MRVFPIALIAIGSFGVAKYFGLIPVGMFHLIGPLLLITLGTALLFRRPRRCRGDWRARSGGGSASAPQPPSAGTFDSNAAAPRV
ncbi:MAG: hypothetical protein ABI433_18030 [Burkholderiaceae bacterium]